MDYHDDGDDDDDHDDNDHDDDGDDVDQRFLSVSVALKSK